jgi:hypothetical protein
MLLQKKKKKLAVALIQLQKSLVARNFAFRKKFTKVTVLQNSYTDKIHLVVALYIYIQRLNTT